MIFSYSRLLKNLNLHGKQITNTANHVKKGIVHDGKSLRATIPSPHYSTMPRRSGTIVN